MLSYYYPCHVPSCRMAYIEENLKIRSKPREDSDDEDKLHPDPQEALYNIADRWKIEKQKPTTDVGSVTNSLSMLTAIPEVDLGMECVIKPLLLPVIDIQFLLSTRLKNIEDTEKAKRVVAEERQERKKVNNDEEHLVASRCKLTSCYTESIPHHIQFTGQIQEQNRTQISSGMPNLRPWACRPKTIPQEDLTKRGLKPLLMKW